MNCDICGKETVPYLVLIEGSELKVCEKCSSLGKIIKKPEVPATRAPRKQEPKKETKAKEMETVEVIVENYAARIRKAREKTGMTQKEFARKINEKESIVHKLETGSFEPPVALARKLEKLLQINLVEEAEQERKVVLLQNKKSDGLTIGDILKL